MSSSSLNSHSSNQGESFLVIGGDGLVGSGLHSWFLQNDFKVWVTTRRKDQEAIFLNLEQELNLDIFQTVDPSVVILTAGITSVDECSRKPKLTTLINVDRQLELAEYWQRRGSRIVSLSSTHVFSESVREVFAGDLPCPSTEYGQQKLAMEVGMQELSTNSLVLRTSKIVSGSWKRATDWTLQLQNRKTVQAFSNVQFAPIHVTGLAETILELCRADRRGVVHLSPKGSVSYLEFARQLARGIGAKTELVSSIYCSDTSVRDVPFKLGIELFDQRLPANKANALDACMKVIDEIRRL